jgi:zinc transport system permease protein
MAIGLILMAKTPGFIDPMVYLFGNILLLSETDLYIIGALDIIVLLFAIAFHHPLIALCFDEENAKIKKIPIFFIYTGLLILTSLTIVLLIRIVGIVLVIALLTLPAAIAGHFSKTLWQMIGLSIIICMTCMGLGLYFSYEQNLPSGPTIGITAGLLYISTSIYRAFRRKRLKQQLILKTSKKSSFNP